MHQPIQSHLFRNLLLDSATPISLQVTDISAICGHYRSFCHIFCAHAVSRCQCHQSLGRIYYRTEGWTKNGTLFVRLITSSNINRFSKLFHYQNQEKICNNTITKDPTTPQVCRYTTLWNVKCLKSNNWCENKMTSVTTHFKKINNKEQRVYCLSYCLK